MRKLKFFIQLGLMCAVVSAVPVFSFSFSCPGGQCAVPFVGRYAVPGANSESFRTAVSSEFRTEFAAPHPSVVRILVENAKTRNYGTGTWIQLSQKRCAVLTCAHLFETNHPVRISVFFPNQPALDVRIQAIDRTWDVALLQMGSGTGSFSFPRPLHLTETAPRPGDFIRSCGYGPDGKTLWMLSTVRGYCRLETQMSARTLVLNGTARSGDSGAPMMQLDGSVAGVLWGTDGHSVYGTWSGQILKIFETAFQEELRDLPAIHMQEMHGNGGGWSARKESMRNGPRTPSNDRGADTEWFPEKETDRDADADGGELRRSQEEQTEKNAPQVFGMEDRIVRKDPQVGPLRKFGSGTETESAWDRVGSQKQSRGSRLCPQVPEEKACPRFRDRWGVERHSAEDFEDFGKSKMPEKKKENSVPEPQSGKNPEWKDRGWRLPFVGRSLFLLSILGNFVFAGLLLSVWKKRSAAASERP